MLTPPLASSLRVSRKDFVSSFWCPSAAESQVCDIAFWIWEKVTGNDPFSGGHINPAVTLSLMTIRSIKFWVGVYYIIFQVIGAVVGAALFQAVVGMKGKEPDMSTICTLRKPK